MHNVSNIVDIQTLIHFVAEELSNCFPASFHLGSQPPVIGAVAYLSVRESVSFVPSMAYCLYSYLP